MDEMDKKIEPVEIGDSGLIFIPDYGPPETDADDDERQIIERISERESHVEKYVAPDMNIVQKADNFWYRNKGLILAAAFALIVFGYCFLISRPTGQDAAVGVYVSFSDYPSSITERVETDLEQFVDDVDGDGEKSVVMYEFNVANENGTIAAIYYERVVEHLSNEPTTMLWLVQKDMFDTMVESYGEDIFESFEGAPLWIEYDYNEIINTCIERGECQPMGLCLRRLDDKLAQNEELCQSYDEAVKLLTNLREAMPEMFEPEE